MKWNFELFMDIDTIIINTTTETNYKHKPHWTTLWKKTVNER